VDKKLISSKFSMLSTFSLLNGSTSNNNSNNFFNSKNIKNNSNNISLINSSYGGGLGVAGVGSNSTLGYSLVG
jgi:hypothetical protein